jgi:AraC family transcriptional regulator
MAGDDQMRIDMRIDRIAVWQRAHYNCTHEVAMGAAPAWTTTKPLYDSAHLSVDHFVSSGHVGAPWQCAEHFHEAIQITVLSARSSLQADWLTICGSRRRKQISGPAICVTPALQPHSMEWQEAQGSVGILVSADFLGQCSEGPEFAIQERYGLHDPFLERLWNLLIDALDAGTPITRLLAESTAAIALEHLRRQAGFQQGQSSGCHRLGQVIEYIHAHLNAELSIVELARIAQTSPFHFARHFKAGTGLTPHQYVMERRIELAKWLLADRNRSIADAAYASGFATQAHLTTVFRRLVGVTPRAYRTHAGSAKTESARIGKACATI